MPGLWITGRSAVDKGCLLGRVRSRSACHKRRFPASVGHRTSTLPHMGVFSSRLLGLPDHPHSSHWLIVDKGLVPIPHIPSGTPGEIQILAESEVSAVLSPPSTALLRLRMSLKMGRGERRWEETDARLDTDGRPNHAPASTVGSDPASQLHGLDHPVDGYHVGSIAHVDLLLF